MEANLVRYYFNFKETSIIAHLATVHMETYNNHASCPVPALAGLFDQCTLHYQLECATSAHDCGNDGVGPGPELRQKYADLAHFLQSSGKTRDFDEAIAKFGARSLVPYGAAPQTFVTWLGQLYFKAASADSVHLAASCVLLYDVSAAVRAKAPTYTAAAATLTDQTSQHRGYIWVPGSEGRINKLRLTSLADSEIARSLQAGWQPRGKAAIMFNAEDVHGQTAPVSVQLEMHARSQAACAWIAAQVDFSRGTHDDYKPSQPAAALCDRGNDCFQLDNFGKTIKDRGADQVDGLKRRPKRSNSPPIFHFSDGTNEIGFETDHEPAPRRRPTARAVKRPAATIYGGDAAFLARNPSGGGKGEGSTL
jgi:hypothetical protein